jgi:hypothetical protein
MNPGWKRALLEAYLGKAAAVDGGRTPEFVLGLPLRDRPPTRDEVVVALKTRLELLSQHPSAGSDEAEVVRQWIAEAAEALMGSATATEESLDDAVATVVAEEGVTPASVERLNRLARARGLGPGAVQASLSRLYGGSAPPMNAERVEPAEPATFDDPSPRAPAGAWSQAALVLGGFFAVIAISVCVLALAIFSTASGPRAAAKNAGPKAPAAAGTASPVAPRPADQAKPAPGAEGAAAAPLHPLAADAEPAELVRAMRRAADLSVDRPEEAVAAFERADAALRRAWIRLDAGERTAAVEAAVDVALRLASNPAAVERIVQASAGAAKPLTLTSAPLAPGDIAPCAWGVGMLARWERERELPSRVRQFIGRSLSDLLGVDRPSSPASFSVGAMLALRTMPLRLLGPQSAAPQPSTVPPAEAVEAYKAWEACVRAAANAEAPAARRDQLAEGTILDGLGRIMTQGPDADQDRAVFEVLAHAASSLRWRADEPARRRLLAWFDNRSVSVADLNALTAAIVTRSSAEGVDLTMVLPPAAGEGERAALRESYAKAWSLRTPGGPTGEQLRGWASVARTELAANVEAQNPLESLRRAAILARVWQAAMLRARGDQSGAADALAISVPAARAMKLAEDKPAELIRRELDNEDSWAVTYLREKLAPGKLALLRQLESVGVAEIRQIDADVLAEAALTPGTFEVQSLAQRVLLRYTENAEAIHAVLKTLPRAGRSASIGSVIQRFAGPTAVGWQHERFPAEARRGLVERLMEALATGSAMIAVDRLGVHLAEAYAAASGKSGTPITPDLAGQAALSAATDLARQLREQAAANAPNEHAGITLAQLDQRQAARQTVARGLLQQFAAQQVACVELQAYILCAQLPARAAGAREIVTQLHELRRKDEHIFQQFEHTEAAMVKLWLLRLGEEGGT